MAFYANKIFKLSFFKPEILGSFSALDGSSTAEDFSRVINERNAEIDFQDWQYRAIWALSVFNNSRMESRFLNHENMAVLTMTLPGITVLYYVRI